MSEYTIETHNLTKRYGNQASVSNLNIHVKKGRIYGLLGRNGAGKTTTMKMLLGLAAPTSGEVRIFGCPMLAYGGQFASKEPAMKLISNIFPAPTIYRWQAAQFVSPDSPAYAIIAPYFLPLWIVVVTVFMIGTISYLVIVKIYRKQEN